MTLVSIRYKDHHIFLKMEVERNVDELLEKIRNVYVNYSIQVFEKIVSESVIITKKEILPFERGFILRVPLEPIQMFEKASILFKNFVFTFNDGSKEEWNFQKKFDLTEIKLPRILDGKFKHQEVEGHSNPNVPNKNSIIEQALFQAEEEIEINSKEILKDLNQAIDRTCCTIYDLLLSVLPQVEDKEQFEMTKMLTDTIRERIKNLENNCDEEME